MLRRVPVSVSLAFLSGFGGAASLRAQGTTTRVSVNEQGVQGDGNCYYASFSANQRFVVFESFATNLVAGDTNSEDDVFVLDRATGTIERVSVDSSGAEAVGGHSSTASISADGRFVAFGSYATNLVAGDTNGDYDVFVRDRATGTTERVSVDSSGAEADGDSYATAISADGRFVAFNSHAHNLVAGDTNNRGDVFVRDRQAGTTERVSVSTSGAQADGECDFWPSISADGNFVLFATIASTLVANDTNDATDVFLRDRAAGTTRRVSIATNGAQGNGDSFAFRSALSADGQIVAFSSFASNLVPGDTNGSSDVFIRDRQQKTTERVSLDSAGNQASGWVSPPSLSSDGRIVAFECLNDDLVPGDDNGLPDVFVRDRQLATTERVSVDSQGVQADGSSSDAIVSSDGRFVSFYSYATNLVDPDTNGVTDIFLRDRSPNRANERVSVDSSEAQGDDASVAPAISALGPYVAFESAATDLVPNDTNGVADVFVRDVITGTTERASVDSSGNEGSGASTGASISTDGNGVAFTSAAANLVPGDGNGATDVFLRDRAAGTTERVSVDGTGAEGNGASSAAALSADGQVVAFTSSASNLVAGDTNGVADVFVHDRATGVTERVSVDSTGAQADGDSGAPSISSDGRYVAFTSSATNLVAGPASGFRDVYVRDRVAGTTERVSVGALGALADGDSEEPALSADGQFVAFSSRATNLVAGDTNGVADVFVRDRATGTTARMSTGYSGAEADGDSAHAWLSSDGRFVTFSSVATNLVVGDTNGRRDVFMGDRSTGVIERESIDPAGLEGDGDGGAVRTRISADGRFVAFESDATNLVVADTNGRSDVFVHDRRSVFAAWWNYGAGFAGSHGVPSFTPQANPLLGSTLTLDLANSSGTFTVGLLVIGFQEASIRTAWGGRLLVIPAFAPLIGVPASGASIVEVVPDEEALSGVAVELQALESDPGAAHGVSFTPGLALQLGR
jgi:Tol biopolymer transport system component